MKVLLVRPRPDPETIGLQHVMLVEPLELEVLGALCRPAHSPVVVDLTLERDDLDAFLRRERPDVLGVTGYITNVPAMIDACRRAKALLPRVATIVGGVHCEVVPGDLDDPAVDFRVVRNAVTGFPGLLRHIEGRGPLPPGVLRPGQAMDDADLPPRDFAWATPERSLAARYRDRYFYIFHERVALMKTAFGCPFKCHFCFCRRIAGDMYRERALPDVLDELQSLPEREVYIVDDDFLVTRERVFAFVDGVKARGIDKHYLVYGRADFIARNEDVVRAFRDAGLRTVIVGFESFLDGDLAAWRKGSDASANEAAMGVLNRLGVECFATLILPPGWGREQFKACGDKLAELDVRFVNLQPLTPLPGTGVEAHDDALIVPRKDHVRWDLAHVVLRPTRLTEAQFYEELIALYLRTLYRLPVLLGHLRRPPHMLWRMAVGSFRVDRQYRRKLLEAKARCRA